MYLNGQSRQPLRGTSSTSINSALVTCISKANSCFYLWLVTSGQANQSDMYERVGYFTTTCIKKSWAKRFEMVVSDLPKMVQGEYARPNMAC
jgi:hypothetical protein